MVSIAAMLMLESFSVGVVSTNIHLSWKRARFSSAHSTFQSLWVATCIVSDASPHRCALIDFNNSLSCALKENRYALSSHFLYLPTIAYHSGPHRTHFYCPTSMWYICARRRTLIGEERTWDVHKGLIGWQSLSARSVRVHGSNWRR